MPLKFPDKGRPPKKPGGGGVLERDVGAPGPSGAEEPNGGAGAREAGEVGG